MGNKLASIANISQMLCIKSQQTNEFNLELNRINALSKELYEGTKDFIWSMDTANNTLHSVYFYIKDFGEKLFEYSGIQFIANTLPDDLENKTVSSLWSSQFILISKEILTNAMAHAKATEVYLSIHKTTEDRTIIIFKDNGIGFDIHSPKRKNGLNNIQARASKTNTILTIYSEPDKGTTASIHIN